MKLFAAKWGKTGVTEIRAFGLWNDAVPGEEAKKDKFNRLFAELREEATADLPEGTHEARLSTLPLIDARFNEAQAALMALLDTWVRGKDEELRESGAYNETTGILFKNYGNEYDGPRAHAAYLMLLDEKILGYYYDARDAYEIAILAGGYSGEWIVSNWEAERIIEQRHGQLLDQARMWMRPSLAEIAILRPMSDYENLVRTRVGKTIESATVWTTLEAKFFQAALDVVNELGRRVYESIPEDLMPSELKTAERLLRSRPQVLEEGQLLPLLSLPCSEVNAILDSLDAILPQILDGSETARVYNRTYALLHTYQQLRCAVGVDDPERIGRPTRYVKLTDSNMRGFQNILDDYWTTILLWAQVEKEAAQSGRSQEYQTTKTAAYAEMQTTIAKIQDDPWGGPLGRDPSGKIIPYAGIGIGYELYGDWIRTLAYEAHKEIKDLFTGIEKIAAEVYLVTEEYATALLKKYSEIWDNPTYGVALQPGFLEYSVLDPSWRIFEAAVRSKIGSTYLGGIEQFEKDIEAKYVEVVLAVRDKVSGLRLSKADEFPMRIKEIEELTEALPYSAYTVEDASNLLAELRLLHSQVPWNSNLQARYGAIYKALMEFIEPRGGVLKVAYRSETNAYYLDAESAFKDDTERDKILAEWIGMDYEAVLSAWQNVAWSGLIALDEKPDLTEWQYPTEQATIIRSATATYLQWRGSLIDIARARLTSLIDRLRTRTATTEDRTLAESGRNLIHPFLRDEIEELGIALEQMLPGAILPAALKPFARFEPLKSVSGFDVEEFSFKHLDKLIKNWAESRIKDGIAVEPKINGYRLILQSKEDDCRIYMEGATKDYSKIYKHLAAEIKTLPTVILDGELVEEVAGKVVDRAALGKYRRSAVDDTNAIVYIFDILYLEGEDLHSKPYSDRREILDKFFAGRSFKHLRKLPSWKVTSIDDLIAKAKKADAYPSSEGSMFKVMDSKYLLGRRTGEWSKAKKTTDIQVMVLKVTKTKADDYVYRCGVSVKDTKGIDPKEIERRGAKEYIVLGNTFRTSIVAKPGDHLEVSITELVEQEGPQGKKYNWMLPKAKDKTTRAVDTLPYAREVGQLLSASIDLPWKFLTDKLNEAMATVSVPRLRALKAELFGVLADFNYIRLVRYAWNVVELIRERLGQAVDPLITNRGVEKIYEIGTVPRTTDRMVDEARSDYKVLTEDIQASPQQKAKRGRVLAQILQGYVKMATGSLLALAEELLKEVQGFISILAKSGTQSILDIDRKLADIERRLDDLLREEPDTLAEDVASLQTELKTLVKAIGESRDLFADHIDAIFSRMEEVELPLHTSVDIREWLRITQMLISEAVGRIPIEAEVNRAIKELQACLEEHGGRIAECMDLQEAWLEARDRLKRAREDLPTTRFLLESTLPLQLTGYWDEMTDTQKTIFKEDFDRLRTVLRETKKMLKGLRGAFLWAAAKPLKLDLGCGQNKEPGGFIGIDIKPGLGIDKVWNLEKGLPYPDDIADEIRAYHILEHLSDPRRTMTEIWRVLKDGGLLRFEIPSTKGEGADADPTHVSRWNALSFSFYTDDELRESHDIPCKFDLVSIEEEEDPETGAVYVRGILRARKTGRYAPSESVAPHFFALRDEASKDTRLARVGQQSASQSISTAEEDVLGLAPFSEQIMKGIPTPIEGPGDEDFNFMILDCFGANPPSTTVAELRRMWNDHLTGWEQYYLENMANRNVRDNFTGLFFDSPEVTAIIKQWPNNWYEEKKESKDITSRWTPKEFVDSVLRIYEEEVGPHFGRGFDYWTHPYLISKDLEERDKKLRHWLKSSNFEPLALQILEAGGNWPQLRNEIERLGTEYIRGFDQELERRARERAAKDPARKGLLGPVEYEAPPGASPEWERIAKMKQGLSEDPMMREIEEEFGPQGVRPFYQAVEGAASGLVRVEDCSGYYGGLDVAGVPFFITAAHCIRNSDPVAITLPNRNMLIATPTQTREDVVLLRIAPKDAAYVTETMKPLPLAERYSGYGLMLGSRYDEVELVHRREEQFWLARIEEFIEIERTRGGYSGGPIINTRGEVMGILSMAQTREKLGIMYPLRTLGFESYKLLRELYKQAGIPWPLTGAEIPEAAQAEPVIEDMKPPPVDEMMDAEELTRQLLSGINWSDIAFYSGTGNPRVRVSPGVERILEPADYENGVRDEVLAQDWIPLVQEIMERTKDKTEIAERFHRKLRIYVRNSTELARNLDAIAKERDPKEYAWLGRMEYEAPPGATEEWFSAAKAKASLAQDPMMLEIQEEFGLEGVNVFNKAIDEVASGLIDLKCEGILGTVCSGYYGGVVDGIPFFVTAKHCVRQDRQTAITLPNGEIVNLTPGKAQGDTQILFATEPQKAATMLETSNPLSLGAEPSGWALALGTHFSEAELLRGIGERFGKYDLIFDKAEDVYEQLHRYRGGYSGGPLVNSRGEVIGLSSGKYFVGGVLQKEFAAYSGLETLKELYRINGVPLPEYLGGASPPIPAEEKKESQDESIEEKRAAAKELVRVTLEEEFLYGDMFDLFPHYSYGVREFITREEIKERANRLRAWTETTDFEPLALQVLEVGGDWMQLTREIIRLGTEYIHDFDVELERKTRERVYKDYPWYPEQEYVPPPGIPKKYPWALGPVKYAAPLGASPEWTRIAKMKYGLAEDPMMREIQEEFGPEGTQPFYQAVEKAAIGLITVGSCSGYYGGIDADGAPFFVTAKHCIHVTKPNIRLPNGTFVRAVSTHSTERLKDIVLLRINPADAVKVTETMEPLSLAREFSGYGLMFGSRFNEVELVRRTGEEYWPAPHLEKYNEVERARRGYSGGPLINSRGEVMGILAHAMLRDRRERYPMYFSSYALAALAFETYELLQELYKQAGIPLSSYLGGAKLTEKGEQPGNERLDFMATEPSKIPIKGTLWTHVRGINPEHKDLGYDEMMKLSTKDDVLNLHHDVRFLWQARYLEGFTLFLGNQEDKDKLLKYDGGKLGASLKQKQPPIWGDSKELDNRLFPPGGVGNVAAKDTWAKMYLVDRVSLLPSRMRSKPKGKRYFEFALAFEKHKELNGLWGITEEAGKAYELPFMMFRLKETIPFWLRGKKKHEKEIEEMPEWMKPTQEAIDEFVKE